MPNPFTGKPLPTALAAAARPASENSKTYMTDLALDKAAHEGQDPDAAMLNIRAWLLDKDQTEVSSQIDRLKSLGYTGRKYRGQQAEPATAPVELEDGFYELSDGMIIKIQHAVHGSGNQYGKLLSTETGKFDYLRGALAMVRNRGTRLTLERARELGQLYGMCIRCGATLTDEDSIERGMGPVCAAKGF